MHAWYPHHSLRFHCFPSFLPLPLHDPLADPLFVFSPLPSMPCYDLLMSPFFTFVRHNLLRISTRSEPSNYVPFFIGLLSPFRFPKPFLPTIIAFAFVIQLSPISAFFLSHLYLSSFLADPSSENDLVLIPSSLHHDEILGIPYGYYLIIYLFPLEALWPSSNIPFYFMGSLLFLCARYPSLALLGRNFVYTYFGSF